MKPGLPEFVVRKLENYSHIKLSRIIPVATILLIVILRLSGEKIDFLNRAGSYFVFLLIWILLLLIVNYLLLIAWRPFEFSLGALAVVGLYMFLNENSILGKIFSGTAENTVYLITIMVLLALLSVSAPGFTAGGLTLYTIVKALEGSLGILSYIIGAVLGFFVCGIVSILLYTLIFKITRPFIIGFSISMILAQAASSATAIIFPAQMVFRLPAILFYIDAESIEDLFDILFIFDKVVKFILNYLITLWNANHIVFILCFLYGLYMIYLVNKDE